VTDLSKITPVAAFDVSERACPWIGEPGARFGAHQYRERLDGTRAYFAWFAGGLRVVDFADPHLPVEIAHYMPEPFEGCPAPQTNDVDVDGRGLVYLLDRERGLEIVEIDA
jgi:hypothetical protein